jgi:Fe-S-cluster containining protein
MRNKKREKRHNTASENVTGCLRCGTCCLKGGPALHTEDKDILLDGRIGREQLITIRKGELAFSPLSGKLEPIQKELVKVAGKGKGWNCCFYDTEKASCAIYSHRPLECRLLKCWDTEELLSIICKDTLARADILGPDDPVMKYVEMHEAECSLKRAEELISALLKKKDDPESFAKLSALMHEDLAIRSRAVVEFGLSVEAELFIFGRPLFKILNARGFQIII